MGYSKKVYTILIGFFFGILIFMILVVVETLAVTRWFIPQIACDTWSYIYLATFLISLVLGVVLAFKFRDKIWRKKIK